MISEDAVWTTMIPKAIEPGTFRSQVRNALTALPGRLMGAICVTIRWLWIVSFTNNTKSVLLIFQHMLENKAMNSDVQQSMAMVVY